MGEVPDYMRDMFMALKPQTIFYDQEQPTFQPKETGFQTTINLTKEISIETGKTLKDRGLNPAVLVMADRQGCIGEAMYGRPNQEKDILRRTDLFMHIAPHSSHYAEDFGLERSEQQYPLDRNFGGIYSKDVLVFRGRQRDGFPLLEQPYSLDFISVAGMYKPETDDTGMIIPELVKGVKNKMRTIYRAALHNGNDSLVLGAMGCGELGNPPKHIAQLFLEVLDEEEFKNQFRNVTFSIKGTYSYICFKSAIKKHNKPQLVTEKTEKEDKKEAKPKKKHGINIIAYIIVLFAAGTLGYYICEYEDYFDGPDSEKGWLSKDVYYEIKYDKTTVFNTKTNKKTLKGKFDIIKPYKDDNLAQFYNRQTKTWGCINRNTGQVAIADIYDTLWSFSEGLMVAKKGDSLYIINNKCKTVAHFSCSIKTNNYRFHNGLCIMATPDFKFGLIDKNGSWVTPAKYDTIYMNDMYCDDDYTYRTMQKQPQTGKMLYGALNIKGEEIFPCVYNSISFSDNQFFVCDQNHLCWRADIQGNVSDEPIYYIIKRLKYNDPSIYLYEEDVDQDDEEEIKIHPKRYAPLYWYSCEPENDILYKGLMDANGRRLTPPIYLSIKALNDNLYVCSYDRSEHSSVLLNAKGQVIK